MKTYALQLKTGQDLKDELKKFTDVHHIKAGYILTAVGNLTKATLRFVDEEIKTFNENFGIVSMDGTLSPDGMHVHIAISDKNGITFGVILRRMYRLSFR